MTTSRSKKERAVCFYLCFDIDRDGCVDINTMETNLRDAQQYDYYIKVKIPFNKLQNKSISLGELTV